MYLSVPALDNQEIRGIHPDVIPAMSGGFVALDLELRHGPVAVVVDLQPELRYLWERQHIPQEYLFKVAICTVGQVVERTVLLRVRDDLPAEYFQYLRLTSLLRQLHHLQRVLVRFQLRKH